MHGAAAGLLSASHLTSPIGAPTTSTNSNLDGFFASQSNSVSVGSNATSTSISSNNSTLTPGLLAHLQEVFGFDWLDDSDANPLD
jgi:hypothetical protein